MSGGADGSDFFDIPTAPTENLVPRKIRFKPWHKPRKHWIRLYQWNEQIGTLLTELKGANRRDLRYLSLPGTELLDVRSVYELCAREQMHLCFIGFNDPVLENGDDVTALNLAIAELRQRQWVHERSTVVADKLEQLAIDGSVAKQRLIEFGSLDVINLDLCNCIAEELPNRIQANYYNAVHALIEHQRRTRIEPFLLFITTRVDEERIDHVAFKMLLGALADNIRRHPAFAEKLEETFGITRTHIEAAQAGKNPSPLRNCILHAFSTALGKWMLKLLFEGSPSWSLTMLESCSYAVKADSDVDMCSYAFLCRPIAKPSTDRFGLSTLNPIRVPQAEERYAIQVVGAVGEIFDLDTYLDEDDALRQKIVEGAVELMRQANFGAGEYRTFAENHLKQMRQRLKQRNVG